MADVSIAPSAKSGKWQDRTGERFGRLVALLPCHRELSSGRKMPAWRLRCDCGNEIVAMTVNLTKGKHKSCGCLPRQLREEAAERKVEYEAGVRARASSRDAVKSLKETKRQVYLRREPVTYMPEYRVYRQMLDRCYLPSARNYPWYGGEGVTVCDRWRHGADSLTGFQCFIADLGRRPDGLTLERDDPREPYGPSNCRWATWKEQAANKREHYLPDVDRTRLRKQRAAAQRKLTPAMRREILARLKAGEKQWPIARSLGLSQTTVSYVKLGQR